MKSNSVTISDWLATARTILFYRWKTVLVSWILVSTVLAIAVEMIPNLYEASTTILAYPRKIPEKYVSAAVVDDPADRLTLLQQEILSSSRLLEVIHKFGLYPKLIAASGNDAAVREMRAQIKIQTSRGATNGPSAFTLTYTGNDAKLTPAVVNELANSFILRNISNREQLVQGTTSFIGDQLDQARKDLQSQEDQLRAFRIGHLGQMPEQAAANLQAIAQLQVQLQAISDKLASLDNERVLLENAPESDPALRVGSTANPAVVLESQLNQERANLTALEARVTDEHPDVIAAKARIQELKAQLASMPPAPAAPQANRGTAARLEIVNRESTRLQHEESVVRARLNNYQSKVDAVPLRQEQLANLTRDYDTAREHYRSLLEKHYSAQMATELEEKQDADRFEVLDPAVPPDRASFPDRPRLWLASVLAGFAAACLLALGRERLDGTIKTEMELLAIVPPDLEIAGLIPTIAPATATLSKRMFQPV